MPSPRMKLDVLPLSCLNKPLAVVEANPYVVLVGTAHVPSPRRYLACAPAAGAGTKPAFPAAEAEAAPILVYVVLGGVAQVPSPRMKLDVLPLSCLNKPLAVVEANPYVVLVGTAHVPSPRRYLACAPAAGAGTKPAFPAAEAEAAPILVYVVLVSVHGTFTYILPFPSRATG